MAVTKFQSKFSINSDVNFGIRSNSSYPSNLMLRANKLGRNDAFIEGETVGQAKEDMLNTKKSEIAKVREFNKVLKAICH
jgi:hypothetical protein